MYNRPMSPHITIYAIQTSSLSSIWHRVSGIFLTSLIVFSFIYVQLLIHSNYDRYLLIFGIINNHVFFFYNILYAIFLLGFFYHVLNGLKLILWDLSFLLNPKFLDVLLIIISSIICLIIVVLIFS
uniref:succinate dehydrogenase subunit 3 n=1 Tax=Crassiphycus crassissimus TaxID=2783451 RepID=UPI001D11E72C|nr:succinate dehydrogenase subunit 3 [Crassiphycus crassissimus]UAD89578.1 succinate dehydrogenase subunit 3 [Crassiphycus crassissimus]